MTFAQLEGLWRLPRSIVLQLSPDACDDDPYVVFRIQPFAVYIRGEFIQGATRQIFSVARQLSYLAWWSQYRSAQDFVPVDR